MRYLNCSRPERFDEFFMNGFHRLLFWSDVSCLWWLIKQWIITALAITCDKNMAWVQMTGIFFIYIAIIARLHKERRYLIIKKKIEKKLDWTWPPRTPRTGGFFSIQRESRLPQKNIHHKIPPVCSATKLSLRLTKHVLSVYGSCPSAPGHGTSWWSVASQLEPAN